VRLCYKDIYLKIHAVTHIGVSEHFASSWVLFICFDFDFVFVFCKNIIVHQENQVHLSPAHVY
jgi:hypothetical protein